MKDRANCRNFEKMITPFAQKKYHFCHPSSLCL